MSDKCPDLCTCGHAKAFHVKVCTAPTAGAIPDRFGLYVEFCDCLRFKPQGYRLEEKT